MAILPNARNPARTAAANEITKTFADGKTIFNLALTPLMPPVENSWKGLGADRLHPIPEGYEIWASLLDPLLNKHLMP